MPVFSDQLNRAVYTLDFPQQIISIVPSQTELLFYLGLGERVVGITNYCIHPSPDVRTVTKIGGTKKLDMQAIHSLKPDLIIANKEENERSQVEALMKHYPVWVSDIADLNDALEMINGVGQITGSFIAANHLVNNIALAFNGIHQLMSSKSAAYFIWRKPYMVAGKGTFIDQMMGYCGLINVFDVGRYPIVTATDLIAAAPKVILLSTEPYPFVEKHLEEFKRMVPNADIILVDGEMFSWYGSRLLLAPKYFNSLIFGLQP
ncbi:cobalamin-binding protein [Mucilaginibacter terrenus]|uniref:Cobalamin-binding protein n=1 Tax=Mucilaginibacter terrenus TaxID=2482727 RepID=A0A3E2NUU4_9SPHI|nr:helical backbone metal receptor [Mucilaginibacter terrenus]RFZ84796.1 cobalamin-binding protein [Mucilaginibacter terrenus]